MGAAKYISKSFESSAKTRTPEYRTRLSAWRKQGTIVRVETPLNPVRARGLGYKATNDYFVSRVKVTRGKRVRRQPDLGRKPAKNRKRVNPGKAWQWFAELKASLKYKNAKVLGSYWVGEDAVDQYYEVVLKTEN
ncbi:hypothetical protein HUU53_03070 [Candidatus Micrarchaeota archaeon]|nr:hypothetical protein [Candidatus Micrarchaeota archaeon]